MSASTSSPNPSRGTGEAGVLRTDGTEASVTFRRFLHHPIERVWAAVTEPEQLAAWFMAKVRREDAPGGRLEMEHPNSVRAKGRVLEWTPPRVYEYEWHLVPGSSFTEKVTSVVRWELSPADGGTVLVVTHRKLPRRTAETFARGFTELIDRLAAHLDGSPLLRPSWLRPEERTSAAPPAGGRVASPSHLRAD